MYARRASCAFDSSPPRSRMLSVVYWSDVSPCGRTRSLISWRQYGAAPHALIRGSASGLSTCGVPHFAHAHIPSGNLRSPDESAHDRGCGRGALPALWFEGRPSPAELRAALPPGSFVMVSATTGRRGRTRLRSSRRTSAPSGSARSSCRSPRCPRRPRCVSVSRQRASPCSSTRSSPPGARPTRPRTRPDHRLDEAIRTLRRRSRPTDDLHDVCLGRGQDLDGHRVPERPHAHTATPADPSGNPQHGTRPIS
jgi:hypothetical protein